MRAAQSLGAALLVGILRFADANAQESGGGLPTFADEMPLELRITAPFRELAGNDDDRTEHDAVIEFAGPDGEPMTADIEVRIRGRSRLDNCSFPPLSLDFPRDDMVGTVFEGQNRLKLVTLCGQASAFRDYLIQEYAIYRMLNLLTDRSFRVRWATVEYIYTDTRRPRSELEPAFLIEEDWEVADRLGMEVIDTERIELDSLDHAYTTLVILFQFLIGNTDWAVIEGPPGESCCHNGKAIGNPGGPLSVLPYDFDNAGMISPPYAVPAEHLPIRSVRRRLYRGFCVMNGEVEGAIARFNAERSRLIGLMDDETIREGKRRRDLDYLNEFFEIVNDPESVQTQIYDRCRSFD